MKFDTVLAERKHKVIYRDGDLCAKVFDESFPKSDILNEALNQARVNSEKFLIRCHAGISDRRHCSWCPSRIFSFMSHNGTCKNKASLHFSFSL